MGLDAYFNEAEVSLKSTNLDLDLMQLEYISKKKKAKEHMEKPTQSSKAKSHLAVTKIHRTRP